MEALRILEEHGKAIRKSDAVIFAHKRLSRDDVYFLEVKAKDGTFRTVPCGEYPLYVATREGLELTADDVGKAIADGDVLEIDCRDLYREYYRLSEEDECQLFRRMSKRTAHYLDRISESIGHERTIENETPLERDWVTVKDMNLYVNGDVSVYRRGDAYCAAVSYMHLDALIIIKHFFDRAPSAKDIETVERIRKVGRMCDEDMTERYRCYECGTEQHWLDAPGNFEKKAFCWEERFCGHCDAV